MPAEPEARIETAPALMQQGKDEMNFAEHPIALLTDRVPKGQTSIKFEGEVYDERKKKIISQKRIIEGSQEYGLPTATDDKVILALIQLTKQKNDFMQREVEFSRLELIRLLGWTNEGKSYDRIKLSLIRIKGVNYTYDNAWWDPRQKEWVTKAFSIIDNVEINDSRASDGQGGLFPSKITWNKIVFESFQAGFVRDIDFHLCMQLEHPTALRMFRFLGKRFYVRPDWTFDLKAFVYIHMNLGRNYEGGTQIARKLQPAIMELESIGFLEPLTESERFPKKGRDWQIRFVKKAVALAITPSAPAVVSPVPSLTSELISRGVGKVKAAELVKKHPAEAITSKIEEFDWLMGTSDKPKRPAGYLVKSIEDGYGIPPKFVSKADRQRCQQEQQDKERQLAEERRRRQQKEACDAAERKAIETYWDSLTKQQKVELDVAAQAVASSEDLTLLDGPMKRYGIKMIRDKYIIVLLELQRMPSAGDAPLCSTNATQRLSGNSISS